MANHAIDERSCGTPLYPLRPDMIDVHGLEADSSETASACLVRYFQQKHGWVEFIPQQLEEFCKNTCRQDHAVHLFTELLDGVVPYNGAYRATHGFITRCFAKAPNPKLLPRK